MKNLVLMPNELSQWHSIVQEAEQQSQIVLQDSLESYLVFLLMRFAQKNRWHESPLGLELLKTTQQQRISLDAIQSVGDQSLLISGLFPNQIEHKCVTLDYCIEIGKTAYAMAGNLAAHADAKLFHQLAAQFTLLLKILNHLQPEAHSDSNPKHDGA